MVIVRTKEEILEWISEQQDYYERRMDNLKQDTALFNQALGGYDCLSWLFEFLTEREDEDSNTEHRKTP